MTYRDAFSYRDMPPTGSELWAQTKTSALSLSPHPRRILLTLPGRRLSSASLLSLHSQIMQNEVLVHERAHSNVRTNVCISNKASGRSRGTLSADCGAAQLLHYLLA